MALQTEALIQVTNDRFADQMPNWSADSQSIVFISDAPGFSQVNRICLESGARQAFDLPYKELSFPTLDKSGRHLAFFTNVPGNPCPTLLANLLYWILGRERQENSFRQCRRNHYSGARMAAQF